MAGSDVVGASAELGVSVAAMRPLVGVDVCVAGDLEAFFLPVERAIF